MRSSDVSPRRGKVLACPCEFPRAVARRSVSQRLYRLYQGALEGCTKQQCRKRRGLSLISAELVRRMFPPMYATSKHVVASQTDSRLPHRFSLTIFGLPRYSSSNDPDSCHTLPCRTKSVTEASAIGLIFFWICSSDLRPLQPGAALRTIGWLPRCKGLRESRPARDTRTT